MSPEILIVIGSVLVAGLVLVVGILTTRRQASLVDQRLGTLAQQNPYEPILMPDELEDEKTSRNNRALTRRLDKNLEDRQFGKKWRIQLSRADLKLTVGEFFIAQFISMVVFFVIAYIVVFRGDIIPSILAGAFGFFFPRIIVGRRISKRLILFENQLADTLALWINALRSGYSVPQAMEAIGRDSPEPTKSEFQRVVQEMQLGISVSESLNHMLERVESEDLDLVVTAVNIQREVGGNLSEILEVIQNVVRERIKLKGEIRVMTSQGRYTGYLISFLPIALGFLLRALNPAYMNQMFEDRACGWPMIGIGLALIGIGAAAIQKIVDIEL